MYRVLFVAPFLVLPLLGVGSAHAALTPPIRVETISYSMSHIAEAVYHRRHDHRARHHRRHRL